MPVVRVRFVIRFLGGTVHQLTHRTEARPLLCGRRALFTLHCAVLKEAEGLNLAVSELGSPPGNEWYRGRQGFFGHTPTEGPGPGMMILAGPMASVANQTRGIGRSLG